MERPFTSFIKMIENDINKFNFVNAQIFLSRVDSGIKNAIHYVSPSHSVAETSEKLEGAARKLYSVGHNMLENQQNEIVISKAKEETLMALKKFHCALEDCKPSEIAKALSLE